jgi:hypothetical protein
MPNNGKEQHRETGATIGVKEADVARAEETVLGDRDLRRLIAHRANRAGQ